MDRLPKYVLFEICDYLYLPFVYKLSLVCKSINAKLRQLLAVHLKIKNNQKATYAELQLIKPKHCLNTYFDYAVKFESINLFNTVKQRFKIIIGNQYDFELCSEDFIWKVLPQICEHDHISKCRFNYKKISYKLFNYIVEERKLDFSQPIGLDNHYEGLIRDIVAFGAIHLVYNIMKHENFCKDFYSHLTEQCKKYRKTEMLLIISENK